MDNTNNNNNNENQIKKCEIEQNEENIHEFIEKPCDCDEGVAQSNEIKDKMSNSEIAIMESIQNIQMNMISEVTCKHDELISNCNAKLLELTDLIEENDYLQNGNEQLYSKLEGNEALLEEMEHLHCTLLRDTQKIQNDFEGLTELMNKCQDRKQLAETELRLKNQDLNCVENALTEKITHHTQLEQSLSIEHARSECLRSSISELNMKYDKTVTCLKAQITGHQSKLNETLPKLSMIKRKLKDKQEEVEIQKYRLTELKKRVSELAVLYFKEKDNTDKTVGELRAEAKTLASDLESINTIFCEAQLESTNLKCQVKGQEETMKHLKLKKTHLEQEVRKIKDAKELVTNTIKLKREQHDKEVNLFEKKFEMKDYEKTELEQSINIQNEKIKKLKKQLYSMKLISNKTWLPDTTTSTNFLT